MFHVRIYFLLYSFVCLRWRMQIFKSFHRRRGLWTCFTENKTYFIIIPFILCLSILYCVIKMTYWPKWWYLPPNQIPTYSLANLPFDIKQKQYAPEFFCSPYFMYAIHQLYQNSIQVNQWENSHSYDKRLRMFWRFLRFRWDAVIRRFNKERQ